MTENLVIVSFKVESEAYQALSELKNNALHDAYVVSQASLLEKQNGQVVEKDGFDSGVETADDTVTGGLVGSLLGVLGGPLGVLLGGSMGLLIGEAFDLGDADDNASLLEHVSACLVDGEIALIALVQEENPDAFDANFAKFDVSIVRLDAAEVADEVERANEVQRQMAKEARAKLRAEKNEQLKQNIAAKRDELKAKFEEFKKQNLE